MPGMGGRNAVVTRLGTERISDGRKKNEERESIPINQETKSSKVLHKLSYPTRLIKGKKSAGNPRIPQHETRGRVAAFVSGRIERALNEQLDNGLGGRRAAQTPILSHQA